VAVPPLTQPAGSPEPLAPGTGTAALAYTKSYARLFARDPVRYCGRLATSPPASHRMTISDHVQRRPEVFPALPHPAGRCLAATLPARRHVTRGTFSASLWLSASHAPKDRPDWVVLNHAS
jgi:hypothetical protein